MKSRRGFTMTELLIVIAILAVLAAIAIPTVAGLIDKANVSADKANAQEMTNAIERFASEYELTAVEIHAGAVDFNSMSAVQSRVVNAVGIRSTQDVAAVEKSSYSTATIAIHRETKYPLNEKTVKNIIRAYLKSSSSTFQPKQSKMSFYYSPEIGVVVCAPNGSSKTELNKIALSDAGVSVTGDEWMNLTINAQKSEAEWSPNVWASNSGSYSDISVIIAQRPQAPSQPTQPSEPSNPSTPQPTTPTPTTPTPTNPTQPTQPPSCTHANTRVENAEQATCLTAGYSGDIVCMTCGVTVRRGNTIAALGHNGVQTEGTDTMTGSIVCTRCNTVLENGVLMSHGGGAIPLGATYIRGEFNACSVCQTVILDKSSTECPMCTKRLSGDYWCDGITFGERNLFPAGIADGDIYRFGEYEYRYNCQYSMLGYWVYQQGSGWGVRVIDTSQLKYETPLIYINGEDITKFNWTWCGCYNLEAIPELPDSILSLNGAFYQCECICEEIAPDALPANLQYANDTFSGATITNTIETALIIPESLIESNRMFDERGGEVIYIAETAQYQAREHVMNVLMYNEDAVLSIKMDDIFYDIDVRDIDAESVWESSTKYIQIEAAEWDGNFYFQSAYGGYYPNQECYDCCCTLLGAIGAYGYDSAAALVRDEDGWVVSADDYEAYSERTLYIQSLSDEVSLICPDCGTENIILDLNGEFCFALTAGLDMETTYKLYVAPISDSYTEVYEDYILIRFNYEY